MRGYKKIMAERSEIEQFYIEKRLPKEVETLPYDILTDEEQRIIDKIREGKASELTDEEVSLIKQTRMEYDDTLKKYDANQIIESNKMLDEMIGTEEELLDFVYREKDPIIKMNLPLKGGTKLFEFTVRPLEDSRAVKFLEQHIDIFRDTSDEERKIYDKANNGEKLNPKEEQVLEHINKKISENQSRSTMENITSLLASQLEEPKSLTYEEKLEFWNNFNFILRVQLYSKVMEKLGLTQEFNDDLFPTE